MEMAIEDIECGVTGTTTDVEGLQEQNSVFHPSPLKTWLDIRAIRRPHSQVEGWGQQEGGSTRVRPRNPSEARFILIICLHIIKTADGTTGG